MKTVSGWFSCVALALAIWLTGPAQAGLVYVTDFTKTANLQANIEPSYPSGIFTPNNGFGTSFDITSDANGHNYGELRGTDGQLFSPGTYTVNVGLYGVTDVYTLMNAYAPQPGQWPSPAWNSSAREVRPRRSSSSMGPTSATNSWEFTPTRSMARQPEMPSP